MPRRSMIHRDGGPCSKSDRLSDTPWVGGGGSETRLELSPRKLTSSRVGQQTREYDAGSGTRFQHSPGNAEVSCLREDKTHVPSPTAASVASIGRSEPTVRVSIRSRRVLHRFLLCRTTAHPRKDAGD